MGVRVSELRCQVLAVPEVGIVLCLGSREWTLPTESALHIAGMILEACERADPQLVAAFVGGDGWRKRDSEAEN